MFNSVTEALIKTIPQVAGVDREKLPQQLSRIYARIVCLKSKYEAGVIPFNETELERDYQELERISNTLELYLMDNPEHKEKKAIAYVAATNRSLMGMIRRQGNLPLSLYSIPENLYAALLYVISGSLADALEMTSHFDDIECDRWDKILLENVKRLISGKLLEIVNFRVPFNNEFDFNTIVEELMKQELVRGVKHLAASLFNGAPYDHEEFKRVYDLSSHRIVMGEISQTDIYTGMLLLSQLLVLAGNELIAHALIHQTVPQGVDTEDWRDSINQQLKERPYLWDNHIEAIQKGILDVGMSSIITFPTGAGKTTLSELKIITCLLSGKNVVYLVPTHALEHQVYESMKRLVERTHVPIVYNRDEEFAILSEEDEDIPIRVMTPEHCLTIMAVKPEFLEKTGLVVFDEFHLMSGDAEDNRAVDSMILMTELLTHLPAADFMLMSAMVSNGKEIAEWIRGATRRKCLLFDNPWKPTSQLQGCVVYSKTRLNSLQDEIESEQRRQPNQKNPPTTLKGSMLARPECLFSLKTVWDTMDVDDYYLGEILDHDVNLMVGRHDYNDKWFLSANFNKVSASIAQKYAAIGMKTIIFALEPSFANSINKELSTLIGEDHSQFLRDHFQQDINRIDMELGGYQYSYLVECTSSTLHHSNLLPEERVLSESYFTHSNGVSVMVATPTIAQGINLPADIVLIAGSVRYDSHRSRMEQVEAHEILNAAGRAGRAGFRSHGTAILIPSKPIGMEDNTIDSIWKDIKDEIFAKGDRCLEVKDPLEDVLMGLESGQIAPQLYKMQGEENDVKKKVGNSFYAYKMRVAGKEDRFEEQVEELVETLDKNKSSKNWITDLALQTRTDVMIVSRLLNCMENNDAQQTLSMSTIEMFEWVESLIIANPCLLDRLMGNQYAAEKARKLVGIKENQSWHKTSVKQLFDAVLGYMHGETFITLENRFAEISSKDKNRTVKPDKHVLRAREFVLKVVPSVSYLCGTVIQVLMAWHKDRGVDAEQFSDDMKVFSLCVKEGVENYDMLMTKYRKRMMRVECHRQMQSLT